MLFGLGGVLLRCWRIGGGWREAFGTGGISGWRAFGWSLVGMLLLWEMAPSVTVRTLIERHGGDVTLFGCAALNVMCCF